MKLKKTILAALAGSAALLAAPAFADNGWHHGHDHWRPYRGHYYPAPRVIVPPRVVYVPAPRVAYSPPVVYAPAPVYRPAPVYAVPAQPSISLSFRLPL